LYQLIRTNESHKNYYQGPTPVPATTDTLRDTVQVAVPCAATVNPDGSLNVPCVLTENGGIEGIVVGGVELPEPEPKPEPKPEPDKKPADIADFHVESYHHTLDMDMGGGMR